MSDDHFALRNGYRLEEYEVQGVLGTGALGITYVALDHERRTPVVIREYAPNHLSARTDDSVVPRSSAHKVDFDTGLNRFLEEGDASTRIAHPNLVRPTRCLKANGTGYIVRDYVGGESLSAILARREALSEEECKKLLFPLLDALEALHQANFLHRDIGPDKIVVRKDGSPALLGYPEHRQVSGARKVFGARPRGSSFVLQPGYAALEQYSQVGHLGAWTDIHGLGVVMYRCATGATPAEATERAAGDDVPPLAQAAQSPFSVSTSAAIDTAIAIRAHERPQSIAAWRRMFEVSSDQPLITTRHSARGQMFAAAKPPEPTQTPSRGYPLPPSPQTQSNPRRKWAIPMIVATAFIALLTWVDTGVLRSSVPGEGESETPLSLSASGPTDTRPDPLDGQTTTEEASAIPIEVAAGPSTDTNDAQRPVQAPPEPAETSDQDLALPTLATLIVETTPTGAEVIIGDALIGKTPLEIADLPQGSYDVTLRHGLYETLADTITVPDPADPEGLSTRMERTLTRSTGALTVSTDPARAWIELDGERLADVTPTTLHGLPAGPLELTVGADGYRSLRVDANVPKNSVDLLEIALERGVAYGTLTLELTPDDAAASLPDLGLAYEAGMRIPAGSHRVRAARDGYVTETRTIEVAGITRSVITLAPDPQPLNISTTPTGAFVSLPFVDHDYSPGVLLAPGDYRVRVVLPGYAAWEGTVNHDLGSTSHAVTLRRGIAEYSDPLVSGGNGPTMIAMPTGRFRMGCVSRIDCRSNELPVHPVTLAKPFALSKFEVTCEDYGHFARSTNLDWPEATACSAGPSGPVVNVSWTEATAYTEWLSSETRRMYRLPSEAEWEYAARAGTTTSYSWGNSIGVEHANCTGCRSRANMNQRGMLAVGSFDANPWGLQDMHGNAWEWVADCRFDDYEESAGDGSARTAAACQEHVLRGGSWRVNPGLVRAAQRGWGEKSLRLDDAGFRVAVNME